MQAVEFPDLETRAAKGADLFSARMVQDSYLFVSAIADVHIFLRRIGRKAQLADGPDAGEPGRFALDFDVPLEVAHLVEHFDPATQTVAHVYQAIISKHDVVHYLQENAAF